MASGIIYGSTPNPYISARIVWTSEITGTRTSNVTFTLSYAKSSMSTEATYGTGTFSVYFNNAYVTGVTQAIRLPPNDTWMVVLTHTYTATHNADGSCIIQIAAYGGIQGLSFNSTSLSGTAILETIEQGSTPTWTGTPVIGTPFTISLNPINPNYKHTLLYTWGNTQGTIGENISSSISWTPPMSFCNNYPNATNGTLRVTAYTYAADGTTLIGTISQSGLINIPASVVPTISSFNISDVGSNVPAAWGVYLKNQTKFHAKIIAAGAYSSTITDYTLSGGGVTVNANEGDLYVPTYAGNHQLTASVTDSRGRTASTSRTVAVLDYDPPSISVFTVVRANSQGTPVDNGTYAKIRLATSGASVGNRNTVTARIYHKRSDVSNWTLSRTIDVGYSYDQTIMIGDMDAARTYDYKVEVADAITSTTAYAGLNAEGAVISWMNGGMGVAFGKAAEEQNRVDSRWKIHGRDGAEFDGAVSATDFKIGNDSLLRIVDVAQVGLNGTNQRPSASDSYVTVQFSTRVYSIASKLTLNSNGIKIPSGVRYVSISAQLCLGAATAGIRYVAVIKNSTATTAARSQKFHASTTMIETHSISGVLFPVTTGDIIKLAVYGNTSDTIYGSNNETYLTVTAYA